MLDWILQRQAELYSWSPISIQSMSGKLKIEHIVLVRSALCMCIGYISKVYFCIPHYFALGFWYYHGDPLLWQYVRMIPVRLIWSAWHHNHTQTILVNTVSKHMRYWTLPKWCFIDKLLAVLESLSTLFTVVVQITQLKIFKETLIILDLTIIIHCSSVKPSLFQFRLTYMFHFGESATRTFFI